MSDKDLNFTEVKWTSETDVDKIKPLNIEDIAKSIADASNNALLNAISANAIIINKKYAKTPGFYFGNGFGVYDIPPMFMGLYVEFKELPKEFAFALTKIPVPDFYKRLAEAEHRAEVAEHRAEVAERALQGACCYIDALGEGCGCCAFMQDNLKCKENCDFLAGLTTFWKSKAEKELAEEGKG